MKSNNKVIVVPIIIILMLLLIAGGAFAYVYMATDILKSDKEMFFKYFSQITSEEGFIDRRIEQFNNKKAQAPYENSGEITVKVNYPDQTLDKVIDKVNDLSIKFEGKIDSPNQKVQQNIAVDYGNNVIFPINYRQDGNKYGLQIEKLSKQYIAIRNDNLGEVIGKIAGDKATKIKNLDIDELIEKIKFTADEKNQLKQIYGSILQEYLLDENFSKSNDAQYENYTLELTSEQLRNIIIKTLEVTKQNTLIIDKINNVIEEYDSNAEKIDESIIDDWLESINKGDLSDLPNLKIILGQNNKKLKQIIIQYEESQLKIEKNDDINNLSYNIESIVKEIETESETTSLLNESSEPKEISMFFNVKYNGLDQLSNVQENYEFGFSTSTEGQNISYDYKINSNIEFTDSVLIETLDEGVVLLNNHSDEQVTTFLTKVGGKILEINKKQMSELGLKEYENPLLYSNPITTLGVKMLTQITNSSINING